MISDAAYFLGHGGQKGPQTTVLTPGKYRLNLFLWRVKIAAVTDIPKGFVAVVKSNVHSAVNVGNLKNDKPADCSPRAGGGAGLAVPLGPVGCIGVGGPSVGPGQFYNTPEGHQLTLVGTPVQKIRRASRRGRV